MNSRLDSNKIYSYVDKYLHLAEKRLDQDNLRTHTRQFCDFLANPDLSKRALEKIMQTLFSDRGTFYRDEKLIDRIIKECQALICEKCLSDDVVIISDVEIVEKISDILFDILSIRPFKSDNIEFAFILSAYMLNKFSRPFFALQNLNMEEIDTSLMNKWKTRVYVGDNYKQFIKADNKIYKIIQDFGDACEYTSNGRDTLIQEWHDLNRSLRLWKKNSETEIEILP